MPEYDKNPKVRLIAWIGKSEYRPEDSPTLIGLYNGKYYVMVKPGESTMCVFVLPVVAGVLRVKRM